VIANLQRADFFVQERQPDKVGKYVPGVDDPLREKDLASDPEGKKNRSRISHAFIYNVWGQYDPQPGVFLYINQSYLDPLVSGQETSQGYGSPVGPGPGRPPGPGSAPPTGEGGQPGATGPQALGPMWTPLGGGGSSGLFPGGPGGPGGPGPGSSASPPGPGCRAPGAAGPGPGPGGPPVGAIGPMPGGFPGTPGTPGAGEKKDSRQRHEFVVMFIWREPAQRIAEDSPPPATGGPAGPGFSPG